MTKMSHVHRAAMCSVQKETVKGKKSKMFGPFNQNFDLLYSGGCLFHGNEAKVNFLFRQ